MSDRALLEEVLIFMENNKSIDVRFKAEEIRTRMTEEPPSCLSCAFELKAADSDECAFCKVLRRRVYDYTHYKPKEQKDGN